MKVIILGAGQVGHSIARYLSTDDNDITVIDESADVLQRISDKIDIKPIQGFPSHPSILAKAQAQNADLLIAVTGSDEVNMVACEMAHSLFGVKTKIARIRHQDYLKSTDLSYFMRHLAIDVIISPELEVAKSLARSAQIAGAFEVFSFLSDKIKIIAVHITNKTDLLNTPLRMLSTYLAEFNISIVCINRQNKSFFPTGDDVIHDGDAVYFIVKAEDVRHAMEIFGYRQEDKRNLLIIGGGHIGLGLAQMIDNMFLAAKVRMIEKNDARCAEAARKLKTIEVLNGDALELDVLSQAQVHETETILALTDDDKVNLLVSLLAKQQGAKRCVTLLNRSNYSGLVTSLGVDAVINPRVITVSSILQYVCQGRLKSVYSIIDGYAELMEAQAYETSMLIGLTVEDVTIRGTLHILAVKRGDAIMIRPKKLIFTVDDILVLIVHKEAARKAEKLFHERPMYL